MNQICPSVVKWGRGRRRRSRFTLFGLKPIHLLLFLSTTFIAAFVTFFITFYRNSDYLYDLYYYLSSEDEPTMYRRSLHELVANYQPRDFNGKEKSISFDQTITYEDFNFLQPKTLTYERRNYFAPNRSFLFRLPKKVSITALLLIFHSCNHTADDWFHTVERQRIIGAAIDLGYACLVFQSTDQLNRCWSMDVDIYRNDDVEMVVKILRKFYKEFPKFAKLPRFTFGESSGGLFSSIFAINQRYPIHGQILFISIVIPEILLTYVKNKSYPPTVWIHMLRDVEFASEDRINTSMKVFSDEKIPHIHFAIEPVSLTATTFHQRIPSIMEETSRYIYYRLAQNRWLNLHNYLLHNPRRKLTWRNFLLSSTNEQSKDVEISKNIQDHQDVITEFLNVIYGEHEISYERSFEALKWLQSLSNTSKLPVT